MDTEELIDFFRYSWARTVKKHMNSLEHGDREIVGTFRTWEDTLDWLSTRAPSSLRLIRPALGYLRIFVEFFEQNVTPGLDASYLWGSVVCLLKLVSRDPKRLDHIPRMVKSLALKGEAFDGYIARTSVVSNVMREVCFDMQLSFVKFFTVSIIYIREAEPASGNGEGPQQRIQHPYQESTLDIGEGLLRLQRHVEVAASSEPRTTELEVEKPAPRRPCIMMPAARTISFFNRLDVFVQLDELLTPDAGGFSIQSVALYGLPGVGKTSIASSYAEKKFNEKAYDVVLWVCGETDASLRQSFTDIARRLNLQGAHPQSHDESLVLVQDWFQATDFRWLVVYDNVESADILAPYWPRWSRRGRAIITTRNNVLAFTPAAYGFEITSWDTERGAEFLFFLLRKNIGLDMDAESTSALILAEKMSGHALALLKMAGIIYDGNYSIKEVTAMYLKNPSSAHTMSGFASLGDEMSQTLNNNSRTLLAIISFLMPDNIPPELFKPGDDKYLPPDLEFLKENFSGFSAAMSKLTTRNLVGREKDTGILSVHRLVQTQFRYRLDPVQRQKGFDNTVRLLTYVVPKGDIDKGQVYDEWEKYNRYLQHVLNLRDIFDEESKVPRSFKAPKEFCEMLNGYQRYLYESCAFEECEKTCLVNRMAVSTIDSKADRLDLEGAIMSHQAQVYDALGDPLRAIEVCQQEIDLRLDESPKKHILLSFSTCNLGIFYSSANDFTNARACFEKSNDWWVSHCEAKGETTAFAASVLVHVGRCMVGLDEFDKAEEILHKTITQAREEKPLNFGTLAYAYFYMGTLERCRRNYESAEALFMEAQNAWMMGDESRIHPFNAGVLYKIGACCLDQFKVEAAIKHIRDSLEVTEVYKRTLPVEHGRSLFKLSEALLQNGDDSLQEAAELRDKSSSYLKKRDPEAVDSGMECDYDNLITILWK